MGTLLATVDYGSSTSTKHLIYLLNMLSAGVLRLILAS